MKTYISLLTIVAITSIAVFGFITMDHSGGTHGGCIATANSAVDCPNAFAKLSDFISLHAGAFKVFTSAVFENNLLSMLLLFALGIVLIRLAVLLPNPQYQNINHVDNSNRLFSPSQQALIRWLSLHENSPTT